MKYLFTFLVMLSFAMYVACNDDAATPDYGLTGPAFQPEQSVSLRAPLPKVYMRLTNQTQANGITKYDAEFRADVPGMRHTGMNVRIWIPANKFGWIGMTDFAPGYAASPPHPAQISTGNASSGPAIFGFPGPARYVNGAMQLNNRNAPPIFLDDWVRLFRVHFSGVPSCPVVILDKETNPAAGGFYVNDGITITCDMGDNKDFPVEEWVTYVNYAQTSANMPFGAITPCQ